MTICSVRKAAERENVILKSCMNFGYIEKEAKTGVEARLWQEAGATNERNKTLSKIVCLGHK